MSTFFLTSFENPELWSDAVLSRAVGNNCFGSYKRHSCLQWKIAPVFLDSKLHSE